MRLRSGQPDSVGRDEALLPISKPKTVRYDEMERGEQEALLPRGRMRWFVD